MATDRDDKKHTSGVIMRQAIRSTCLGRTARKSARIAFETGITTYTIESVTSNLNLAGLLESLPTSQLPVEEQYHVKEMCQSTSVNFHEVIVESVLVQNFRLLIIVCGYLTGLAFILLFTEFLCHRRHKRLIRKCKAKVSYFSSQEVI